jgi:hypothetical protein
MVKEAGLPSHLEPNKSRHWPETGFDKVSTQAIFGETNFPHADSPFSLIRHEQIQSRYRQSFRLRLVPKASPCFTRRVMVEFVDKHREIISE